LSTKDTLERIATALEGIEFALMVGAGLWELPEIEQPDDEVWECTCGLTLAGGDECPNCHATKDQEP